MDILVIRFSSLGDVIITTAVIEALRENFSESRIYFLTKSIYSQVFDYDDRIFRVIGIQGNESPFEFRNKIALNKFDIVIDLHSSLRSVVVSTFLKSPLKLRLNKHSLARRFMIWSRNRFRRRFDTLGNYLETIGPLGIHTRVLPKLIPGGKPPDEVNIIFNLQKNGREGRVIGITPGARYAAKRWNEESFARLADEIAYRGDLPVFLGDRSDIDVVERIQNSMKCKSISITGLIKLSETIELISRLDCLVTNDSGPMHIAGALGIPFAAVFGPTHPDLGFCPEYQSKNILHSGASCSPCSLHGASPCRMKARYCMDDISWEMVLEAIDKII